jgi:hypothetical protein
MQYQRSQLRGMGDAKYRIAYWVLVTQDRYGSREDPTGTSKSGRLGNGHQEPDQQPA